MTGPTQPVRRRPARAGRGLGVTGVITGGLVVLTMALIASWALATRLGVPGPAPDLLAWHAAAAVATVFAQVRGDRTGRAAIPLAVCAAALLVLALLWFL